MPHDTTWIRRELPDVELLYQDERRRESARRGRPVDRHDTAVRLRVAERLLNGAGERIRQRIILHGVFPPTG